MDRHSTRSGNRSEILLVEDNPGDVRLVEEALEDADDRLHAVRDGRAALDFLHQREEFPDAPQPDVVLLDLNLPRVDGGQILEEIRSDPELERIRVVVLTSATEDVAGDVDADTFITKPTDPETFMERIRSSLRT